MDISSIFLFCLMSLLIGAVLMLLIQYYAFIRYFNLPEESSEQKLINEKYSLPENILSNLKSTDPDSKYPIVAINLIMQFLFHELKNSNKVRKWFYRKLSLELDELIAKTTTGKLFDKLTIRDLDLGGQFPEIKNLRVHNAELHDTEGHIENLDLLLDLQYKGNFRLSIDADMVLGKKGSLTLKVKHLSGLARLQFTRKPYTHWSLSFLGDPELDFHIESQFQGRQMQSNVTSLILNQIRKAVRRKHTLPNYKLRYKPFFHKIEDEIDSDIIPNGKLEMKIIELSRLMFIKNIEQIYCTTTLASLQWVEARQQDDKNIIISIDIEIHKARNQQIGIVFKQSDNLVQIEAVLPNTPAVKANLRSGDILISIEGKRVTNITQVAKIIKNLNQPVFSLRVERISPGIIRNDAIFEDYELYEDFSEMNIAFSKSTESVQLIGTSSKLIRKGSIEKGTSSESSIANTPTNSPRKSQIFTRNFTKNFHHNDMNGITTTTPEEQSKLKTNDIEYFQQHSTIDCQIDSFIRMEDLCTFKLDEKSIYLNICVYGRSNGDSTLLGYLNVPINNVLAECSESSLGQHLKSYNLLPPDTPFLQNHLLAAQSGFDPNLCYGDILLSFIWNGSTILGTTMMDSTKKSKSTRNSTDKLEESDKIETNPTKQHNFIRTHFHRTTQCDFCGKKIWLKDAVQCRDCSMCCHKKCVIKCQNSTVCGPVDCSTITTAGQQISGAQPEFKLTEAPSGGTDCEYDENNDEVLRGKHDGHRQSFSDLLVQGLKRVNSANNLAIPGIVSSLSQSSRSLPPSPQHTPSNNPFITITQRLEMLECDILELSKDQILHITEPLIGWSKMEDLMSLAKTSSKMLYADLDANERVNKINGLLTKLRIALDSETTSHANLLNTNDTKITQIHDNNQNSPKTHETIRPSSNVSLFLQTKAPSCENENRKHSINSEHEINKAILVGQSEERVQVLSVIMLYLCTGLQHAQGVASQ